MYSELFRTNIKKTVTNYVGKVILNKRKYVNILFSIFYFNILDFIFNIYVVT